MHESAPAGGLRKVKRTHYVQITNDTVRDTRISYRALGILTELLSHEEGWVVRTKDLGRRRKEGTDAIAAALRELAAAGYYRVERRRKPSGKFSMGTAVADYPIAQWAEDFKRYPRGGVPVRVDENDNLIDEPTPEPGFPDPVTSDPTGTGFPGPGFPGPDSPVPLEDLSQNTITEGSAALRAATAPDPVETSSSSVQERNASAPDAADAAGDHGDAPRAGGARQTRNPADILDGMMLNPDEAQRFRGWLVDATGATNPDGLIVSLHGSGLLSERLTQWRASESAPTSYAATYAPTTVSPQRPGRLEWCGRCDSTTRMEVATDHEGREYVRRCPTCHVLAGVEQPGAGAHQVIAMQAATAARATGAGRAAFQAARAQLPAGTPRRDTTIGTTIDPTTARETAESEH
jgi:hypothetical protein